MKLSSGCPYLAFTGNPLGDYMGIAPADAEEDSDCGLHASAFREQDSGEGIVVAAILLCLAFSDLVYETRADC